VAIGANLSALWILVANAWMQNPVGTVFNPETARNEMTSFWEVLFSPVAINKFLHTITSGFVLSAIFVIGVSGWFLLKKRHIVMARKSILVAAIFGLLSSAALIITGDGSAKQVARVQPMKLAAMEGLNDGKEGAGLILFGIVTDNEAYPDNDRMKDIAMKVEVPKALSFLAFADFNAFVPGINDLIHGNEERGIMSAHEKIKRGKVAVEKLTIFKDARKNGDEQKAEELKELLVSDDFQQNYFKYLGYGDKY
jgi:cytochrome d ubiquinol oxidase subunit I